MDGMGADESAGFTGSGQRPCVLLVGNPNVGKSVVFSRLTGVGTMCSNYPGTTVEFLEGSMRLAGERVPVIDRPRDVWPCRDVPCRGRGVSDP